MQRDKNYRLEQEEKRKKKLQRKVLNEPTKKRNKPSKEQD